MGGNQEAIMSTTKTPERQGAMSVDVFAKLAAIGRTTAWNEIRLGRLRAIKVGARTLVTLADAQAWLSSLPQVQQADSHTHIKAAANLDTEDLCGNTQARQF
jgi:hypothetical protein